MLTNCGSLHTGNGSPFSVPARSTEHWSQKNGIFLQIPYEASAIPQRLNNLAASHRKYPQGGGGWRARYRLGGSLTKQTGRIPDTVS